MADVVSGDQSGANPSSNRLTIDAALTEWVYHRADQDQGLSLREIAKDASIQIIDGFLKTGGDGFIYNSNGFGAAVVKIGDVYTIVYRGTDLADAPSKDLGDLKADADLGVGTFFSDSQAFDAINLASLVLRDYAFGDASKVHIVGQSLGGGLAGLAAAAIGSTATLIAPAPFSNSLYTAAWSETLRRANISPPSNLNPNTIRDFIVARYDAATYEELDSVAEGVYSAYKNFILSDNVEVYRNKGEFLTSSTTGTIIDSSSNQFKPATDTFDLGDGNGLSLHSPTLSALEIRSMKRRVETKTSGSF